MSATGCLACRVSIFLRWRWRQDFARAVRLQRTYETCGLHCFHEPRSAVITNLQTPLHAGNGCFAGLEHDPYGFVVKVVPTLTGGDPLTGQDRCKLFLHRDADTLDGFPKQLAGDGEASPLLADLDGDNRNELVLANSDGRLLRISAASLKRVMQEAPALAAGFLYELSRSIGSRVRTLTQKYQDSIHFSRMGTAPRE